MRKFVARRSVWLGVAVGAAIVLQGCADLPQGPAGTVTAKDTDTHCHMVGIGKHRHQSCSTMYELTTRDAKGSTHEFRVVQHDYEACYRGSAYPHCKEVR